MQQIALFFHCLFCVTLVVLVLLQQGKGAAVGPGFGGASGTLFGSRGPATFLMKLTFFLGFMFFVTSLSLDAMLSHQSKAVERLVTAADLPLPSLPNQTGSSTHQ